MHLTESQEVFDEPTPFGRIKYFWAQVSQSKMKSNTKIEIGGPMDLRTLSLRLLLGLNITTVFIIIPFAKSSVSEDSISKYIKSQTQCDTIKESISYYREELKDGQSLDEETKKNLENVLALLEKDKVGYCDGVLPKSDGDYTLKLKCMKLKASLLQELEKTSKLPRFSEAPVDPRYNLKSMTNRSELTKIIENLKQKYQLVKDVNIRLQISSEGGGTFDGSPEGTLHIFVAPEEKSPSEAQSHFPIDIFCW